MEKEYNLINTQIILPTKLYEKLINNNDDNYKFILRIFSRIYEELTINQKKEINQAIDDNSEPIKTIIDILMKISTINQYNIMILYVLMRVIFIILDREEDLLKKVILPLLKLKLIIKIKY